MFKINIFKFLKKKLSFSKFFLGVFIFLGLVLMFQTGRFFWENKDVSSQNVTIYVQDAYIPGGVGSAEILIKALDRDKTIEDGNLKIYLREKKDNKEIEEIYDKDFEGNSAVANFSVPELESGAYVLEFRVKTDEGKDEIKKEITIREASKIIISTDRPLYKPGQQLEYRTLLLNKTTLKPIIAKDVIITVTNPKGDKIFRKELKSSDYGICSGSFSFAEELAFGDYNLSVQLDGNRAEKIISVKDFSLPKYEVNIETDQDISKSQEKISGVVLAKYFFGKALTNADVLITLRADGRILKQEGKTDKSGIFRFNFFDEYLINSKNIQIQAKVSENGQPAITSELASNINSDPILLELIPESKKLKPGIENNIIIVTSNANGDPLKTTIVMTGEKLREFASDEYGIANFSYTPDTGASMSKFNLKVRDDFGNVLVKAFTLQNDTANNQILLRTDKAYYNGEASMDISVLSIHDGQAKVEIVQDEYVLVSENIEVLNGVGELSISLNDRMFGLLEVRAIRTKKDNSSNNRISFISDSKFVVIDKENNLNVSISKSKDSFLPGEEASFTLTVEDENGNRENSALAIKVVDEALLALQDDDVFSRRLLLIDSKAQANIKDFNGLGWGEVSQKEALAAKDLILQAMLSGIPSFKTEVSQIEKDNYSRWREFNKKKEGFIVAGFFIFVLIYLWQILKAWRYATRGFVKPISFFSSTFSAIIISVIGAIVWNIIFAGKYIFDFQIFDDLTYFSLDFLNFITDFVYLDLALLAIFVILVLSAWNFRYFLKVNYRQYSRAFIVSFFLLTAFALLGRLDFFANSDFYTESFNFLFIVGITSIILSLSYLYLPSTFAEDSFSLFTWIVIVAIGALFIPFFVVAFYVLALALIFGIIRSVVGGVRDKEAFLREIEAHYKDSDKSEEEIKEIVEKVIKGEPVEGLDLDYHSSGKIIFISILIFIVMFFLFSFFAGMFDGGSYNDPRSTATNIINMTLRLAGIGSVIIFLYGAWSRFSLRRKLFWRARKEGRSFMTAGVVLLVLVLVVYVLAAFTLDAVFRATTDGGNSGFGGWETGSSGSGGFMLNNPVGLSDSAGYSPQSSGGDSVTWGNQAESIQSHTGLGNASPPSLKLPSFGGSDKISEAKVTEKKISFGDEETEFKQAERVRKFFPETMYWRSELIAENGQVEFSLPVKDSITRWKMSAFANALSGKIGVSEESFTSFQDFFLKFDLPVNLSVGDELVLPIDLFNYLEEAQILKLVIRDDDWFDVANNNLVMEIPAGEKKEAYIGLKIKKYGDFTLRIDAQGTKMADAVEKIVKVEPLGRLIEQTVLSEVMKDDRIEAQAIFPDNALADTKSVAIKFYPTIFSQIVEGLDSILRLPNGCFEQTSSSLYPNILVLSYLDKTDKDSPEIRKKAEDYINKGMQKILNYEIEPGGFSYFGHSPAETVLTAYGLLQFNSLRDVMFVDQNIIDRTRNFLKRKQKADGSFQLTGNHRGNLTVSDTVTKNAYVIWSLSESGEEDINLNKSYEYLSKASKDLSSNYSLALIANAMQNIKPEAEDTKKIIHDLKLKVTEDGENFYIPMNKRNHYGSFGNSGNIEVSALAAIVFSRSGDKDFAEKLIDYIIKQKSGNGNWGSTQSTILALSALVNHEAITNSSKDDNGKIKVAMNDQAEYELVVSPETADVIQFIDFKDSIQTTNNVNFIKEGKINTTIQMLKKYYEPWDTARTAFSDDLSVETRFDYYQDEAGRAYLNLYQDTDFIVELKTKVSITNGMLDILMPSGFVLNEEKMSALLGDRGGQILTGLSETSDRRTVSRIAPPRASTNYDLSRYEQKNGRLILYFDFIGTTSFDLRIPMKPMYEGSFTIMPSRFYSYYDPGQESFSSVYNVSVLD